MHTIKGHHGRHPGSVSRHAPGHRDRRQRPAAAWRTARTRPSSVPTPFARCRPWPRWARSTSWLVTHGKRAAGRPARTGERGRPGPDRAVSAGRPRAQTQGMIGYWLLQALQNALPGPPGRLRDRPDVGLGRRSAFAAPTKFVGPVLRPADRGAAWRGSAAGTSRPTAPIGAGWCRHRFRSGWSRTRLLRLLLAFGGGRGVRRRGRRPGDPQRGGPPAGHRGRHRQGPRHRGAGRVRSTRTACSCSPTCPRWSAASARRAPSRSCGPRRRCCAGSGSRRLDGPEGRGGVPLRRGHRRLRRDRALTDAGADPGRQGRHGGHPGRRLRRYARPGAAPGQVDPGAAAVRRRSRGRRRFHSLGVEPSGAVSCDDGGGSSAGSRETVIVPLAGLLGIAHPDGGTALQTAISRSSIRACHSRLGVETTNGDGVGVGWYGAAEGATPALVRGIGPAWSDPNLREIAGHVRSPLFLAHIRASTGTAVQHTNSHPFRHGRWLWVHNGAIRDFPALKRELILAVDPELYPFISGSTDSEVMFLPGADLRPARRNRSRPSAHGRRRGGGRPPPRRAVPDADDRGHHGRDRSGRSGTPPSGRAVPCSSAPT